MFRYGLDGRDSSSDAVSLYGSMPKIDAKDCARKVSEIPSSASSLKAFKSCFILRVEHALISALNAGSSSTPKVMSNVFTVP